MQAALLTFLLAAGVSPPVAENAGPTKTVTSDYPYTFSDYSAVEPGLYNGYPVVVGEHFCRFRRFSPPSLYCPRNGYDSVWYRYFYQPTYNYRHQFNFPWHSPPYRPGGCLACRGGRRHCLTNASVPAQ